jgi:hypothetical protein
MATEYIKGGDKLTAALVAMSANVKKAAKLRVGFLENASHYPKGEGLSVATVAAIQEFGAPGATFPIPPRPFFRPMVKDKSPEWPAAIANLLKANDYDAEKALTIAGHAIGSQLQQSIIDTNDPPLSEVTLMLRKMRSEGGGSFRVTRRTVFEAIRRVRAGETSGLSGTGAKPLIDTGHLYNSVDSEVE